MLRLLRISILLYALAFVAVGSWITQREATDWDLPLRVHVHALAADAASAVAIDSLDSDDFARIERFFADEAQRHGVRLAEPFSFYVEPTRRIEALPAVPHDGELLGTLAWSLRMRWLATRLRWASADPLVCDITLFVVFHSGTEGVALDRSTALRKGLIAVANVFADEGSRERNDIVIAHELLHTLGATDKYAPTSNFPSYPDGFADPNADPLYPQARAELMAGRLALDPRTAEMPASLRQVVVGPATAREIRWNAASGTMAPGL